MFAAFLFPYSGFTFLLLPQPGQTLFCPYVLFPEFFPFFFPIAADPPPPVSIFLRTQGIITLRWVVAPLIEERPTPSFPKLEYFNPAPTISL